MTDITLDITGTITFTSGSAAIVGTGTLFTGHLAGDVVFAPDGKWYELAATPTGDLAATLDRNYAGTTATGAVGGTDWVIFKNSVSRDSVRTATKQLTDISSLYRQIINLTQSDQTVKLSKATAADRAGLIVQKAGVDLAQVGTFGDDDLAMRYLLASTWTKAFGVNTETGATTLYSQLLLGGICTPATITADTNDYNPTGLAQTSTLRVATDASRTLTGIAGGAEGRVLLVANKGSNPLVLADQNSGSAAANRFAFGSAVTLSAGASVLLSYDAVAQRWCAIGSGAGGGALTATSLTVTGDAGIGGIVTSPQFHASTSAFSPATPDAAAFALDGSYGGGITFLDSPGRISLWSQTLGAEFHVGFGTSAGVASFYTFTASLLTLESGVGLSVAGTTLLTGSVSVGTPQTEDKFAVVGDNNRSVVRGSTTGGSVYIEAQANDYWSTPSFAGTSLRQYGTTAAGTNGGVSNASLGQLYFQNVSAGWIGCNNNADIHVNIGGVDVAIFNNSGSGRLTTALLAGGSAASSTLTLESTTGAGTSDAILFKTGSQLERMRIKSDGRITIGGAAAYDAGYAFELHTNTTTGAKMHAAHVYWGTSGDFAALRLFTAPSGAVGTLSTPVALNGGLGAIDYGGSDGTSLVVAAGIDAIVDGTVTTGHIPSRLVFFTMPAGGAVTERMRLDNGGYLYLNQTAAINGTAQFQLASDTNTVNGLTLTGYSNTAFAINQTFQKTRGAAPGTHGALVSNDVVYNIVAYGSDGSAWRPSTRIQSFIDNTVSSGVMPGGLTFSTSQTSTLVERMRINSIGNVLLGKTTTQNGGTACVGGGPNGGWASFSVEGANSGTAGGANVALYVGTSPFLVLGNKSAVVGGAYDAQPYYNQPTLGTTASAANAFINNADNNTFLRSTSSLRYKKNVEPVDDAYRDAVLSISPIWYRSKAKADNPNHSFYGFAAEEVAAIDPRLCHWTYLDEDYEMVDTEFPGGGIHPVRTVKAGAVMVPDAVMYDRVAILQIAALAAKVAALEQKVGV